MSEPAVQIDFEAVRRVLRESGIPDVRLLHEDGVIEWIVSKADFATFLARRYIDAKCSVAERTWGNELYFKLTGRKLPTKSKKARNIPDDADACEESGQWTTLVCEAFARELYLLHCKILESVTKPVKCPHSKRGYKPDWIGEDFIVEVKAQAHYSSGTAYEKYPEAALKYVDTLGTVFKAIYAHVVFIGQAEVLAEDKCGLLGKERGPVNGVIKRILQENGVSFKRASDILKTAPLLRHLFDKEGIVHTEATSSSPAVAPGSLE